MLETDREEPGFPIKRSVALVILNDVGELLVIRRSDDDDSLPGTWGLPAASLRPGESEADAVLRAGRDKLGVEVEIVSKIGEGSMVRPAFFLSLSNYYVRVLSGVPRVPQADPSVSQYGELQYVADPSILVESARLGSVCSRIYLDSVDVEWWEETPSEDGAGEHRV